MAGSGGAWKVAFADFMTALMALFLVLWIVAMSQEMKESIAGYFRSSSLLNTKAGGVGLMVPITQVSRTPHRSTPPEATSVGDTGGQAWAARVIMVQATLQEVAGKIIRTLQPNNDEITDTEEFRFEFMNDGFRIHAMDRNSKPMFEDGTSSLTDHGEWVLRTIAWEVDRFPFRIEVEGHINQKEGLAQGLDNDWELSSKRAIIAQQVLAANRIPSERFWRVAGYADKQPLDPRKPTSDLNRRISVILRIDDNADPKELRRAFELP